MKFVGWALADKDGDLVRTGRLAGGMPKIYTDMKDAKRVKTLYTNDYGYKGLSIVEVHTEDNYDI
jgi:hypothetical protein